MTTADWALLVSLLSFAVSLAGFVWNIWSKFIYPKARVRCSIAVMHIVGAGPPAPDVISLQATNYGPTDVTLTLAMARHTRLPWRRQSNLNLAALTPLDHALAATTSGPFSGSLPKKLAVGESHALYFPASSASAWLQADLLTFGVADTFGRYHWVGRKWCKEFLLQLRKEAGMPNEPAGFLSKLASRLRRQTTEAA